MKLGFGPQLCTKGVIGVTACDRREPCRREHVGRVEEGAAEAIADEMLRVQWVLAAIGPSGFQWPARRAGSLTATLSISCSASTLTP